MSISAINTCCPKPQFTGKRNNYEKQLQKKIMNIIGIKFQERQICVSKKECIKSTKLIYNEEEEVI